MTMRTDGARASDVVAVAAGMHAQDDLRITGHWWLEKWDEPECEWIRRKLGLAPDAPVGSDLMRKYRISPYEEMDVGKNLLLNAGITVLLQLAFGTASPTAFNNASGHIGVGDSSTAASASQTDLQAATNKFWASMNAANPSVSAQTATMLADFTTGNANYVWNEIAVGNGSGGTLLNRKVSSMGTKVSGLWTPTLTIAVS